MFLSEWLPRPDTGHATPPTPRPDTTARSPMSASVTDTPLTTAELAAQTAPRITTELPGPLARTVIERDQRFTSPSLTRVYPLVVARGGGAVLEDVDGNRFLDFNAGIAVNA